MLCKFKIYVHFPNALWECNLTVLPKLALLVLECSANLALFRTNVDESAMRDRQRHTAEWSLSGSCLQRIARPRTKRGKAVRSVNRAWCFRPLDLLTTNHASTFARGADLNGGSLINRQRPLINTWFSRGNCDSLRNYLINSPQNVGSPRSF